MDTSGRIAGLDPRAEIIERLYDVAIDPDRYEQLLDSWESRIGPMRPAAIALGEPLRDAELEAHFERADVFLDRLSEKRDARDALLESFANAAALIVGRDLTIQRMNPLAAKWLGVEPGAGLRALPLGESDTRDFADALARAFAGRDARTMLLRFRSTLTGRAVLFQIRLSQGDDPFALVVTSEHGWPDTLDQTLIEAFGLTPSEIEIVRGLAESRSVREIADERGRSVETVRKQIKAILHKTRTNGQNELVRVCLAFMDIVSVTEAAREGRPTHSASAGRLRPRSFHALERPDGRCFEYLVLGRAEGEGIEERTFLYLPIDYGLVRWPASAEAELERRGLRALVPVRPGYGNSTPLPWTADRRAAVADDLAAMMDAHGVRRAPVLALGSDGWFAFGLEARHPGRVSAFVLAGGGSFPNDRPEQYERMEKWHRFIIANGKYAPRLLPFLVKAGFSLARRIGKRGFIHAVYGNSPADIATFEDPEVYEAMIVGSEVALSETHSAHEAFSQEIVQQTNDWGDSVEACRDLPIVSFNGTEDPQAPPATVAEWRERFPFVDFRVEKGAGQLIFFQRWRTILDEVEAQLGPAHADRAAEDAGSAT